MNKLLIASAIASPLALGAGGYGAYTLGANSHDNGLPDGYARVVQVEPMTRDVVVNTPRRECKTIPVATKVEKDRNALTGTVGQTVIGGAIGAAVGSQIGDGRGKDIATVGGGLAGAAIGAKNAERTKYETKIVNKKKCKTVQDSHTETRSDGYRVTYEYDGQLLTTKMDTDPGDRVRVQKDVRVVTE